MISAASATLIISVVQGSVLAGRQIDQLLTVRKLEGAGFPALGSGQYRDPQEPELAEGVRKLKLEYERMSKVLPATDAQLVALKEVIGVSPPFRNHREAIELAVELYFPDKPLGRRSNPQVDFVKALKKYRPDLASGPAWASGAAFLMGGEDDEKNNGALVRRCTLIVLDQLFEIGSVNATRIVSDPEGRKVLESVLKNLADSNLQDKEDVTAVALLRVATTATLDGVLAVRADLKIRQEWLNVLLEGIAGVKEQTGGGEKWEAYVTALMKGQKGAYQLLVASLLQAGSDELVKEMEPRFRALSQALLVNVAEAMEADPNSDYTKLVKLEWSGLLVGAVKAVQAHGAEVFKIEDEFSKKLMVAVLEGLEEGWGAGNWTAPLGENFIGGIISALGNDKELLEHAIDEPWLRILVGTVTKQIGAKKLGDVFKDGKLGEFVRTLVEDSLAAVAGSKELREQLKADLNEPWLKPWVEIIADKLSSKDLRAIFTADGFGSFAKDLVQSSLAAIVADPSIVADKVREDWLKAVIGNLAESLQSASGKKVFSKEGLAKLASGVVRTFVENPSLISGPHQHARVLAVEVVAAVLENATAEPQKTAGDLAQGVVTAALKIIAERPALVGVKYPVLVGSLAKVLSESGFAAKDAAARVALAERLIEASLLNPAVLVELRPEIPAWVLAGVSAGLSGYKGSIGGLKAEALLDAVSQAAVAALAARGKEKLEQLVKSEAGNPKRIPEVLRDELKLVLGTALDRISAQVGSGIDLGDVPKILEQVLAQWAAGQLLTTQEEIAAKTETILEKRIS